MSTKIYTRTGDKGQTGLLGGKRVAKSDPRIDACGNLDELNAWLGWLGDQLSADAGDMASVTFLRSVQERLFTAGSLLACEPGVEIKFPLPELFSADVSAIESAIDHLETHLPPLKNFILPAGHVLVSQIHIARNVCRRAERSVVLLGQMEAGVPPLILQYLNRLSDYLFVFARATGRRLNVQEVLWQPVK